MINTRGEKWKEIGVALNPTLKYKLKKPLEKL